MRKSSKQILKELLIDREINTLPKIERESLLKAVDDLFSFRTNELESLIYLKKFSQKNDILHQYVSNVIVDHAKNILVKLGMTVEGWKETLNNIEKSRNAYDKIRNKAG